MTLAFFMKEVVRENKEQAEHLKVKHTQDRIKEALANRKVDKVALTKHLKALADNQLVTSTNRKKKDAGIDMALRSKVGIEYGYVGDDKRLIADPNVLEKKEKELREANYGKPIKKMTEKEFFAQEIKPPKNSWENQVVSMKDTLKKLNNS